MTRIIARNSAPIKMNKPAALKNARIRKSTECTGLRAETTSTPEAPAVEEKMKKRIAWTIIAADSNGSHSGMPRRGRPGSHEHGPMPRSERPMFLDSGLVGAAHAPE